MRGGGSVTIVTADKARGPAHGPRRSRLQRAPTLRSSWGGTRRRFPLYAPVVVKEDAQDVVSAVERRAREVPRGVGALVLVGSRIDEHREPHDGIRPPARRCAGNVPRGGRGAGARTRGRGGALPGRPRQPLRARPPAVRTRRGGGVAARGGLSGALHRPLARGARSGGAPRRGARRGPSPHAHRGADRGRCLRPAPHPRAPRPARRVRAVRPGQRSLLPRARSRGGARRRGRAGARRPCP